MARFGTDVRVEKKGAIDLVTDVDVEVERMFRALIGQRFPDHDILAEELGQTASGARYRWVFDPLDGTTNYAHGLPIFCSTVALEFDGEADRRRRLRSESQRSCSPPSAASAPGSTARRCGCRRRQRSRTRCSSPVSPTTSATAARRHPRALHRLSSRSARHPPARLRRDRPLLGRGRPHGRVLGAGTAGLGHDGRGAHRPGGRRARHRARRRPVRARGATVPGVERPDPRRDAGHCPAASSVLKRGHCPPVAIPSQPATPAKASHFRASPVWYGPCFVVRSCRALTTSEVTCVPDSAWTAALALAVGLLGADAALAQAQLNLLGGFVCDSR